MEFVPERTISGRSATKADENQECAICFDDLNQRPCCRLCSTSGHPICGHIFHSECANGLARPLHCPFCRREFVRLVEIPKIQLDPRAWFAIMDEDNDGALTYEEIIHGLKSQLKLDWHRIETDVDTLFSKWDADRNGTVSFTEFADPSRGVMAYLQQKYPQNPRPLPPNIRADKHAWFRYWDEDNSGELDKDEVIRALVKTFRLYDIEYHTVVNMVDIIWPLFDVDGSGKIDINEFVQPDNLADTICAQLAIT
jgi:Ca2+-binding EF-hand superfamily protein